MTETHICDKCGDTIRESNHPHSREVPVTFQRPANQRRMGDVADEGLVDEHLCSSCADEFDKWLRRGSEVVTQAERQATEG